MKVLKKIGNILLNLLIGIVVILLVLAFYNYIQINVLKNKYANYFGYTFFEIQTGSMEPLTQVDDYVFVKITDNIDVEISTIFYLQFS